MIFRLIDEERHDHAVSRLARALGVTRAGYHAWKRRPPSVRAREDARLKTLVATAFEDSLRTYGAPRIHAELALEHGVSVSRKRVARLMRELGIEGVSRRRRKGRAVRMAAEAPAAPDLVRREFAAKRPNMLWTADITYIPTYEGWLFLAIVADMCTRRIVGWSMGDRPTAGIVVDALSMALATRKPPPGLVHHSDRGAQYRSLVFGRTLRESGIAQSMGSKGDAYDNAATESVMSTIKTELVRRNTFKTRDAARLAVFSYIETFYNPLRRHSALGYLSPVEFEKKMEQVSLAAGAA
jgi:putative transposase